MRFEYFEIRPCVETDRCVRSFLGEPEFHEHIGDKVCTPEGALAEAQAYQRKHGGKLFWTLYGRDEEGLAHAIGDFDSFEDTLEILNAILAPLAAARDKIDAGGDTEEIGARASRAACDLDDVINQSSNEARL